MFNWLREWYALRAELNVCNSCEVLKVELNRAQQKEQMLLNKIFELTAETPSTDEMVPAAPTPVSLGKGHIPFRIRQQELERMDREKAEVIQRFHKKNAEVLINRNVAANPKLTVEELEKQLGVVQGEV